MQKNFYESNTLDLFPELDASLFESDAVNNLITHYCLTATIVTV